MEDESKEKAGRVYLTKTHLLFYASPSVSSKIRFNDIIELSFKKSAVSVFSPKIKISFHGFGKYYTEFCEILESKVDTTTSKSLHNAISTNNYSRAKFLLQHPDFVTDFSKMDEDGRFPIHAAFFRGSNPLVLEMLKYFETKRLDINIRDQYGLTPLHTACYFCLDGARDNSFAALLNYQGIDIDAETNDEATAFHIFMQRTQSTGSVELANLLFSKGTTKINAKNKSGETPLHYVIF